MRPSKPKMLVVDDEPDNLELLYRTFRREFQVYTAISGSEGLKILQDEGEVAVIISDQRMPEMKGTEFLSRTVSDFPNTIRIILTGFTDIDDLVEAINTGQVYKYITKPWEPTQLRQDVEKAASTYLVLQQRTAELARLRAQMVASSGIVEAVSDCTSVAAFLERVAQGIAASSEGLGCAVCQVKDGTIAQVATAGAVIAGEAIKNDPLVVQTLSEGTAQMTAGINWDQARADLKAAYEELGLVAHAVVPAVFRDRQIGLLSLQWRSAQKQDAAEVDTFGLYARQIGLALSQFEGGE